MSSDRPTLIPSRRRRLVVSLRGDFLFWLCLLVTAWVVFLVPQVHDVIFQTVQRSSSPQTPRMMSSAAWVPFFYLLYLSLLLCGTAASILFVVPPSFLSAEGRAFQPAPPPPLTRGAIIRKLAILLVLALGGFLDFTKWLGDLYPWLPVLLLSWLLFPWVAYGVFHASAWLVRAAGRWPLLCGRRFGLSLVLGGVSLWVLLYLLDVSSWRQPKHPLGLLALNALGLVLVLIGAWLGCIARAAVAGQLAARALGRLIGWLVCGLFAGEAIWLFASLQIGIVEGFAYRLYTVWSILQLLIVVVLVGSMLDTWEESADAPIRLCGLLALSLIGLLSHMPGTETLEQPSNAPARTAPGDWPAHFLARIRRIPQGEPVVLVASSGGGSRAAIFSGLVLEALQREPFPGTNNTTWGDHVVLISSVSGGSLGTARFVHHLGREHGQPADQRQESLRHSYGMDLVARMSSVATELRKQIRAGEVGKKVRETFKDEISPRDIDDFLAQFEEALRRAETDDTGGDWSWVMQSAIMDDLCADFMAPTLRGTLMPLLSRGASLRLFWRDQFGWNGSNDRGGYAEPGGRGRDWQGYPLVIFNAADSERGSRLAFGFPPLPAGFQISAKVKKSVLDEETYHPPQTLADLNPERSIDLHQAVFLSANLPYGFTALTIPRHHASDGDQAAAKILDGGIVDNTGIDSLFLVLEGIRKGKEVSDQTCSEIWTELDRRRVLLVEINSGRKPASPGTAIRWFSLFHDPASAVKNARFDHAGLAKRHYFGKMRDWLGDGDFARLSAQVSDVENGFNKTAGDLGENLALTTGPLRKRLEQLRESRPHRFESIRFECTHLGQSNVQTAWSLGPQDKARVLVRFLVEMQMHRGELKEWAADTARTDAAELVKEQMKAFFCPLLEKSLAQVHADARIIFLLGKEGAKSRGDLQSRLMRIEARLSETEEIAKRFDISMDIGFRERLANLHQAIRFGKMYLGTHDELTAEQLANLNPAVVESLVKSVEPSLQQQRKSAELRASELLSRLERGVDWKKRFQARSVLSREMYTSR